MNLDLFIKKLKTVQIQGEENITKESLKILSELSKSNNTQYLRKVSKTITSARPTEPLLQNSINYLLQAKSSEDFGKRSEIILERIEKADKIIAIETANIIKNNSVVFTHCHSSTVMAGLKKAKQLGKRFSVYCTETRPLFQGRITAKELLNAGIPVTFIVDSFARQALKKSDIMIIGADAILKNGDVINKIGSGTFAELASKLKVPVYICADSWKIALTDIKIEQRPAEEVWQNYPKKLKILNPAFEVVESENITAIISELGVYKPSKFVNRAKKHTF